MHSVNGNKHLGEYQDPLVISGAKMIMESGLLGTRNVSVVIENTKKNNKNKTDNATLRFIDVKISVYLYGSNDIRTISRARVA